MEVVGEGKAGFRGRPYGIDQARWTDIPVDGRGHVGACEREPEQSGQSWQGEGTEWGGDEGRGTRMPCLISCRGEDALDG